MAAATVGTTTVVGLALLECTSQTNDLRSAHPQRPLTVQEAHFRAMIEDARESTWKEKWDTVAMAQEQLMVPGSRRNPEKAAEFVEKINARSKEIVERDQEQWRQRKEFENEQNRFATTIVW